MGCAVQIGSSLLMVVAYVIIVIAWSVSLLLVAAYGIRSHLLARHIRAHHPILWKTLREPDLYTAQGRRPDPLRAWLTKEKYLKMHDPYMLRWCPRVHKLGSFTSRAFLVAFVLSLVAVIVSEFFWK